MTEYYSISTDFSNGIRAGQLGKEINSNTVITTILDGINTDDDADNVAIVFDSTISGAEKTALDGIVALHTPNIEPKFFFVGKESNTVITFTADATINRSITFPDTDDTVTMQNSTQPLANKELNTNSQFVDSSDSTKKIGFDIASAVSNNMMTLASAHTGNRTVTLPDTTDTVAVLAASQTLSNKTLVDASVVFADQGDTTKVLDFSLGGASTSTTTTIVSSQTANRSITLPNATDTLVGRTTTDTLTNKTLTTPVISSISNTGTLTLPTSTDTLLGRATSDTLTNKILTSTTNNVAANSLKSATGVVSVAAAVAPSSGQILTATGATTATWQNAAGASEYFAAYDAVGAISITSGFTDITWDTEDKKDSAFTHSADSAEITVNESADYIITADISIESTNNSRSESVARIMIDTGSGFVEAGGTLGYTYHRNSTQMRGTISLMKYTTLSSTNRIKVQATRNNGGANLQTAPNGCRILIQKV